MSHQLYEKKRKEKKQERLYLVASVQWEAKGYTRLPKLCVTCTGTSKTAHKLCLKGMVCMHHGVNLQHSELELMLQIAGALLMSPATRLVVQHCAYLKNTGPGLPKHKITPGKSARLSTV